MARSSAREGRHAAAATPRRSGKALASVICGVLGLFLIPLVLPVAAIVLGVMARREIEDGRGLVTGIGMAQAGIAMGVVGVAIAGAIVALAITGSL
jgi:thiol:disulfide interchange protein